MRRRFMYSNVHICNKVLIQSLEGALVRVRVRFGVGVGVLERAKETLETLNGFLKLIYNCIAAHSVERFGGKCWQTKKHGGENSGSYGSTEDT